MSDLKNKIIELLKKSWQRDIEDFGKATEFLLRKSGLGSDVSSGTIPQWVKNQEKIEEIENRQINNNIEPNIVNKTNTVYQKETVIYQSNVFIATNNTGNLPDKPGSLIPVETGEIKDNQTPTKVNIGAPITLSQSISNQSFGKMLFNPFVEDVRVIKQLGSTDVGTKIVEANAEGIEKLASHLVEEEGTHALDAVAMFVPTGLRGLSGKINTLVGTDTLRFLISNLTANSTKALMGISDLIPKGYEVETYEPVYAQVPGNQTGVSLKPEEEDRSIAVPAWWQVRLGASIPQLACVFRKGGSRTYHSLSIPHPANTEKVEGILLPAYTKGSYQGMVVCKDNSKFIINCNTQEEAERMCSLAIPLIQAEWLESPPRIHIGKRKGQAVSVDYMTPTSINYYPTGQQNLVPAWRVKVKDI